MFADIKKIIHLLSSRIDLSHAHTELETEIHLKHVYDRFLMTNGLAGEYLTDI